MASVVLNYNSSRDLSLLLPQLKAQGGIRHTVIVVDNASRPDEAALARHAFLEAWPDGFAGSVSDVVAHASLHDVVAPAYLAFNDGNDGYSAGNNIGARIAGELGADAVLIANPDMRIDDIHYVARLHDTLVREPAYLVAASRIVGLDGKAQSPLSELSYWEEFFWPLVALRNKFGKPISHVLTPAGEQPVPVEKVSGCCLMLRSDFLRDNGYLDEGVFLYCEEPILAAQVRRAHGLIVFDPRLLAVHAHEKRSKGIPSRNMLHYIESRRYFTRRYSRHGRIARLGLSFSYGLLKVAHGIRLKLGGG